MSVIDEVLPEAPEYFHRYMRLVGANDPIIMMEDQPENFDEFFGGIDPNMYPTAYQEGKWTIKEVMGHIVDSERVFGYRALAYARGDAQALPNYDQDAYIQGADFNNIAMDELLEEFYHLRQANILLFRNLSEAQLDFKGTSNGKTMTLRSLQYIIPGHAQHHINVVESKYV